MSQIIVNGFNIGTELSQVILSSDFFGQFAIEELGHLESLSANQEATRVSISPVSYGGRRMHRNIYHDFSGNIKLTRYNNRFTQLINRIMQRFQNTGAETYFTMYTTIQNSADNTVDELLYQQVVLDQHNLGDFTGTAQVDQGVAFRCQSLYIGPSTALG